jgi:hypothetical protein
MGVGEALIMSALSLLVLAFAGLWFRLSDRAEAPLEASPRSDPSILLPMAERRGPIRLEIEYAVKPDMTARFTGLMGKIRTVRCRSGAYDWSLARDIAQPDRWFETYSCPTWLDYLHQRSRLTRTEDEFQGQLSDCLNPERPPEVRRLLKHTFDVMSDWR